MPPTFDLRTYRKLETAMIRHLVKDWQQRSAPIFEAIATACRNRQWNEARRRVPELDLHETGTENKEWIKYFLHSFAVFGGGCVAKQRPSFVGVGAFEDTLNQVAQNVVTYLEFTATSQVQTQTLQLIAEDEAMATAPVKVAYDPAQPRDEQGQWTRGGASGAPPDPKHIVQRLFDRASGLNKRPHEDYQPVQFTDDPRRTRLLLPDGTRLTSPMHSPEHAEIVAEALLQVDAEGQRIEWPPSLGDVMAAGVVRYTAGQMGGVEIKAPLTVQQAQVIADDFNIAFQSPVMRLDMSPHDPNSYEPYETASFDTPVTADKIRYWSQAAFRKLNATVKWDAAKHPRDKEGQFAQVGSVTIGDRVITVVKPKRAMRDTLVLIDVAKFDAQFAKDPNFYLSEGGGPNAIGDRYARFGKFLADQPQLPSMEASEVYVQPDGGVGFTNGRHRYAWLRDHGVTAIPVALDWQSLLHAKKHGYLVTQKREYVREPAGSPEGGQFARSRGFVRQPGDDPITLEGAGPERQKWEELNVKAADSREAYVKVRAAHHQTMDRLRKQWGKNANLLDNPEYRAAEIQFRQAQQEVYALDTAIEEQTSRMKVEIVTNLAAEEAAKLGVPAFRINVVDHVPREFTVGGRVFSEGGHFSPDDEQIEINAHELDYGDAAGVRGMVAHESSHFVYYALKAVADQEHKRYLAKAFDPDDPTKLTPWAEERLSLWSGDMFERRVKPEFLAEMAKEFPASAVLAELAGGVEHIFEPISAAMIKENGHSAYAKSYWTPEALAARGGYESAINETMAEITRFLSQPQSWHEDQPPNLSSPWVQLTGNMHRWYKERQARIAAARAVNR